MRASTKHHKWTAEEEELLKNQVRTLGFVNGCKAASAVIGASFVGCEMRIVKLRKEGFTDYADIRKGMNAETIALIKQCVQENPNNLQEAFRTASVRTGLAAATISKGWYDKKSRKSRDRVGTCFCLVGTTGAGVNRKNCVPDSMSSHRSVFGWLKSLLRF